MMHSTLLTLLLFSTPFFSWAQNSDYQSWNTFTVSGQSANLNYSVQMEARYSEDERAFYEEHFKPYIGYNTDFGEFGFVFSFLADEAFTKTFEKRYAFQYSKTLFSSDKYVYDLRLRQEFRDFAKEPNLSHRFRLRNQFKFPKLNVEKWTPYTSSEFNVYTNNTRKEAKGFSSHRLIAGISKRIEDVEIGLSFTHNYKKSKNKSEIKYSLGINIEVEI